MRNRFLYTRTLPGLEDSIETERLRFRTEPPAGGDGGAAGGEGGGEGGGAPAAAPPAAPAATPPANGNGGGGSEFDKDRAMATIKAQRESEDRAKAELQEERQKRETLEREKLSEQEKKDADHKATQDENARLKQVANQAELLGTLATDSEIADPEIARDLLIARGLTFGDDGKPVGLEEAKKKLLEEKPLLRKGEAPAPGDDGAGNGGGSGGGEGGSPAGGATPPPAGNGAAGSGGQGPPPQLSADEVSAANAAGQTTEQYAKLRDTARKNAGKVSVDDWQASKPPAEKQE